MFTANDFVNKLVESVRKKKFADYIKASPEEVAESLRGKHIFVSGEFATEKPGPGQSKVGGNPDLPESLPWPAEEETASPLAFIAQINLGEVHKHDLSGRLPEKGMLWFFTIADGDRAYGEGIDESTSAVLYDPDPGILSPREMPEELLEENEFALIEERRLLFGPSVSLSGYTDSGITDAIVDALREIGGRRGSVHILTQYQPSDYSSDEDEDSGDDSEGSDAEMVSLIEMDGYEISSDIFVEGIIEFVLSEADLVAGKLERASCQFTAGT